MASQLHQEFVASRDVTVCWLYFVSAANWNVFSLEILIVAVAVVVVVAVIVVTVCRSSGCSCFSKVIATKAQAQLYS